MTRRAWAAGFFTLLMFFVCALLILHWDNRETVTYLQASIKHLASVEPHRWPNGTVNVNTADFEELQTLTGINRGQMQALLDDRAKNGPFDFPEDLIYVKGIGEKTLQKIYTQLDFSWRANGD